MLIFILALVFVELFAIFQSFTKSKLQNISGTHDATWWLKLAADFPSLNALSMVCSPYVIASV